MIYCEYCGLDETLEPDLVILVDEIHGAECIRCRRYRWKCEWEDSRPNSAVLSTL